jgi:hypothetical protein
MILKVLWARTRVSRVQRRGGSASFQCIDWKIA